MLVCVRMVMRSRRVLMCVRMVVRSRCGRVRGRLCWCRRRWRRMIMFVPMLVRVTVIRRGCARYTACNAAESLIHNNRRQRPKPT